MVGLIIFSIISVLIVVVMYILCIAAGRADMKNFLRDEEVWNDDEEGE